MKTATQNQIEQHGANLNAIFNTGIPNIDLCKKLHRLENKASRIALNYCNGEQGITSENINNFTSPILAKVKAILGDKYPVFFNGDARGYSLKISDKIVKENNLQIYTDWGGNGIIAPDFN